VTLREIVERRIAELKVAEHPGVSAALRAAIGTELINAWMEGLLFTDEDVIDMMKDARKEGYKLGREEGYEEAADLSDWEICP
jgi:hypothetical protein